MTNKFAVEESPLGRVYVPDGVPAGFSLFYTTRDFDGTLNKKTVPILQEFIAARFGMESTLYTCHQVHGTDVRRVDVGDVRTGTRDLAQCDAMWSNVPKTALGIKIADCLPVSLIDPKNHVIANVHAGWRGTARKISGMTLERLKSESSFDPASATAFLGPSIRDCCFEVGAEVVEEFRSGYEGFETYVHSDRGPRPYLDLIGLTARMLIEQGIPAGSVVDSGLCTRCNGSAFHSYRREKGSGRNLAIVAQ